uniref:Uncharacterized protein n=1 Tax=Cyanoderma ruficeps TaxID=181631 RepID=A0A8C3X6T3_9PASS
IPPFICSFPFCPHPLSSLPNRSCDSQVIERNTDLLPHKHTTIPINSDHSGKGCAGKQDGDGTISPACFQLLSFLVAVLNQTGNRLDAPLQGNHRFWDLVAACPTKNQDTNVPTSRVSVLL